MFAIRKLELFSSLAYLKKFVLFILDKETKIVPHSSETLHSCDGTDICGSSHLHAGLGIYIVVLIQMNIKVKTLIGSTK